MNYFSMFSGIGGFELGIGNKGNCVGYSEIDKHAIKIYNKHFPEHTNFGDATKIRTEDLPDFELLVGGFPCQAFSVAGKRCGFDDPRGNLFFEIARILRDKKPRYLLLENVKGLLSHDNGSTFKTVLEVLTNLGYNIEWQVLNSKDFGVPQSRERIFIIGYLRGTSRPKVFPIIRSTTEDTGRHNKEAWKSVQTFPIKYLGRNQKNYPTTYAPTLDTMRSWGIYDGTFRHFTPIEYERLQGFPDNWTEGISDIQRYKCCGNAVTVNVIQNIMGYLL